jgi:hypothetical protein
VNENLETLRMFAQFPVSLRRFLRHTLTLDEARAIVHERMAHREENFLQIAEHGIYGNARSPYLPLLSAAGCDLGDLRTLVKGQGLEGALRRLREAGVYITFEEFKGRKPIERSGLSIAVAASDFDNPRIRRDFTLQTGGSTGVAIKVGVDLEDIAARSPLEMIGLAAHGLLNAPSVRWTGILPDGSLRNILRSVRFGRVPARWFSPRGLRDSRYWVKYGLATYYMLAWMRLFGVRVPLPETAKGDQAAVVARSVAELVRQHGRCSVTAPVSRGLRVALAAQEAGIDLRGAVFVGTSEPATSAKVRQIAASGAGFVSSYGMVETNRIGIGCARTERCDDLHLHSDAFALFTHPYPVPGFGVTVPAFNITSLLPTASKVMLNIQMDDYGLLEERCCGCDLESYGYTTHIREIRSYSKLTGEGVTLIGNEVTTVLEEVLPARFGGSPLDYQLVEQEDEQGFTRLYLFISPRLEIPDEGRVIAVVLEALRDSSPMADAARTIWQHTGALQVKRMEPIVTDRGKHFPLRMLPRPQPDNF